MDRDMIPKMALAALAALLMLVACGTEVDAPAENREPFTSRRESENGIVVEWSGYTAGHEPGEEVSIGMTLTNNTEQVWPVRFCIQLLDREDDELEITRLETREFRLDPGVGQSNDVPVEFPMDLEPGGYGLSLVMERPGGPMVDVIAIRVLRADADFDPLGSEEVDAAIAACLPTAGTAIEVPAPNDRVTLPLRVLAHVGEPGGTVTALLRLESGMEVSRTLDVLEGPDGNGFVFGTVDFAREGPPPELTSQPGTVIVMDGDSTMAQQPVAFLRREDPATTLIDVYWVLGDSITPAQRYVPESGQMVERALEGLLWGPAPPNLAGFTTAIPTPEEVLTYPGRQPDWGARVELLGVTVEDGLATVNFSAEMAAYGGGSARVQAIRDQVTQTVLQFEGTGIDEVQIAVAGETEGVLQP
jgi:hypothetical protein